MAGARVAVAGHECPATADRSCAGLPRAIRERVCVREIGAGVEPATARFSVWCSTTELTTGRNRHCHIPFTERTGPTARAGSGAPPAKRSLYLKFPGQRAYK